MICLTLCLALSLPVPTGAPGTKSQLATLVGPLRASRQIPSTKLWVGFTKSNKVCLAEVVGGKLKLLDSKDLPQHSGGIPYVDGPEFKLYVSRIEIVVAGCYGEMAGDWPSAADVYTRKNGNLSYAGMVASNAPIEVSDLDRDGSFEMASFYEIGFDLCHAEQPRWTDLYGVVNGHVSKVSSKHPARFDKWKSELWATLRDYPLDKDLWAFYGYACQLAKAPTQPSRAYQRMIRELKSHPHEVTLGFNFDRHGMHSVANAITRLQVMAKSNRWPNRRKPVYVLD